MKTSHQKRLKLNRGSRNIDLIFEKGEDRWGHRLLIDDDGMDRELLRSIEGNDQQAWPPSPPIQNLDQQDLSGGCEAVLGVGGAGRSHWSASFSTEVFSEQHASKWGNFWLNLQKWDLEAYSSFQEVSCAGEVKLLHVEIASLVKGNFELDEVKLQSHYQVGNGFLIDGCCMSDCQANSQECFDSALVIRTNQRVHALIVAAENTLCDLEDGQIVIAPRTTRGKQNGSICWNYRIAII